MSVTQSNGACAAILVALDDIMTNPTPKNNVTPLAIQALLDEENTAGVTIDQIQGKENGHIKQVRVMRHQRTAKSEIRDAKSCDPGSTRAYLEDVYSVNLTKEHAIKVKESDVRRLCDAYSVYEKIPLASRSSDGNAIAAVGIMREIVELIMIDLDVLRQAINEEFIAALALHIGTWVGGDASKNFHIFKTDGERDWQGMGSFKQEMKKTGMKGRPIIISGGLMDIYYESLGMGCCNNGGYDFAAPDPKAPNKLYFDDSIGTELGNANAFVAFWAKAIQLMTFNEYVGEFARPIDNIQRGTLPDPELPGLRYDMRIIENGCDEDYDIILDAHFDFYFAPDDLYATGDRLEGVNGIVTGIATNS